MGRGRREGSVDEEIAKHPGVELHGKSLRIWFMWKRQRCRETLGIEPTKSNVKYAAQKRAAILHEIKTGTFNYSKHFPDSPRAKDSPATRSIRLSALRERYWKVKTMDITAETERRYSVALDVCCDIVGPSILVDTLMPEDIDNMRADLIATRKPSTANHHIACWNGMVAWGKANEYLARDLKAQPFSFEEEPPDPLTFDEFRAVIKKGCLHPQDVALITLAVYTGIRPGELCALAKEDVDGKKLHIRRAVTVKGDLKITKTGKERTIWLVPPAKWALDELIRLSESVEAMDEAVMVSRHQSRTENLTPIVTPLQAKNNGGGRRLGTHGWSTKWRNIVRRAGIRYRRVYQTRHTFACWSLSAHGNIAFIANQMGHKDYSMLVKVYGKWMDEGSEQETGFIWAEMQKTGAFAPNMPQQSNPED